jgi:molybdopterin-containing oxidoreductase family membrane subunit
MTQLVNFFKDSIRTALTGSRSYYVWLGALLFGVTLGCYGYSIQFRQGLAATGMSDHVSWGFYISNFTFLVGVAAAAVMLVLPAYILKDVDFGKAVLLGEGLAVAALIMCLCFVTVDLGGPLRVWHMMPVVGYFNWPNSMLAWDVIVLNGYLVLNLAIPFYILFTRYRGKKPNPNLYVPFVYLSVIWAVGIHLVTAFLYAGLPAKPFWNSSLMGPRFLASAFAGGPALIILILYFFKRRGIYEVSDMLLHKLGLIVAIAAQVNLIMLASELFKEFYWPTEHSHSAIYMFLGLDGHNALSPTIWAAIACNVAVTVILMINKLRWKFSVLIPCCIVLFCSIWVEKGMGLVVPGFIPSPLGEIVEYSPTYVELLVSFGIVCLGGLVFTVLAKPAIAIEQGELKSEQS